jgi:hypothetical protein
MALALVNRLPYDHPYRWDGTLFGGPKLWRPTELGAALALWLDAEDTASITLNGSNVSQWSDKSGRNNHLPNAVASTQPAYQATGWDGTRPTIYFDGVRQDVLFATALTGFPSTSPGFFMSGVFEMLEPSIFWDMICGHRSARNGITNGVLLLQAISNATQIGSHNTDVSATNIPVHVTTRLVKRVATVGRTGPAGGNGGTVTVTATGNSQPSYLTTATQSWSSVETSNFQVGGRQQSSTGFGNRRISEIVCCSANLSTNDRQKLEGYLAHKWGIAANLPNDHPYKTTPPTV